MKIEIEEGKFYFLKDEFFELMKDNNLSKNKDNGNKRPCYYCFKDKRNDKLIWFIPISSKIEKYKEIYQYKMEKYKKVDNLVFGNINDKERAFLIQNMFPTIEQYIEQKYVQKNIDVEVTYSLRKEIEGKANYILNLAKRGKKVIFPDIIEMQKVLLEKLL